MKTYFAHSFSMRDTPKEKEWIDFMKSIGLTVINPFDKEYGLEKKHGGGYYDVLTPEFAGDIVINDLLLVNGCDLVIAWFLETVRQTGTSCELMFASINEIPIVSVDKRHHPFIVHLSDIYYDNFETLKENLVNDLNARRL